ncbi:unnamed protein product [Vitrella brassicaformis CCMP3155]|uniref:non-specific serine/threonine protein kinase n=2 Tax=Vitrella brassicaformis TaxID=1169539 RepID=A0A0G4H229_VITBC|nr:unnamed protein product [Vitrella brassicaformis CCMP3155]|eukprot:CEM37589.1 unnamed protein product [Vitrella brassicaformis CCMP3155]
MELGPPRPIETTPLMKFVQQMDAAALRHTLTTKQVVQTNAADAKAHSPLGRHDAIDFSHFKRHSGRHQPSRRKLSRLDKILPPEHMILHQDASSTHEYLTDFSSNKPSPRRDSPVSPKSTALRHTARGELFDVNSFMRREMFSLDQEAPTAAESRPPTPALPATRVKKELEAAIRRARHLLATIDKGDASALDESDREETVEALFGRDEDFQPIRKAVRDLTSERPRVQEWRKSGGQRSGVIDAVAKKAKRLEREVFMKKPPSQPSAAKRDAGLRRRTSKRPFSSSSEEEKEKRRIVHRPSVVPRPTARERRRERSVSSFSVSEFSEKKAASFAPLDTFQRLSVRMSATNTSDNPFLQAAMRLRYGNPSSKVDNKSAARQADKAMWSTWTRDDLVSALNKGKEMILNPPRVDVRRGDAGAGGQDIATLETRSTMQSGGDRIPTATEAAVPENPFASDDERDKDPFASDDERMVLETQHTEAAAGGGGGYGPRPPSTKPKQLPAATESTRGSFARLLHRAQETSNEPLTPHFPDDDTLAEPLLRMVERCPSAAVPPYPAPALLPHATPSVTAYLSRESHETMAVAEIETYDRMEESVPLTRHVLSQPLHFSPPRPTPSNKEDEKQTGRFARGDTTTTTATTICTSEAAESSAEAARGSKGSRQGRPRLCLCAGVDDSAASAATTFYSPSLAKRITGEISKRDEERDTTTNSGPLLCPTAMIFSASMLREDVLKIIPGHRQPSYTAAAPLDARLVFAPSAVAFKSFRLEDFSIITDPPSAAVAMACPTIRSLHVRATPPGVVPLSSPLSLTMDFIDLRAFAYGGLLRYLGTLVGMCGVPFVQRLHSIWLLDDGCLAIAAEHHPIGSVGDAMARREGPFPVDVVRLWMAEVLVMMCYVHERDIGCGYLCPEYLLLDDSGHIALACVPPKQFSKYCEPGSFIPERYLPPEAFGHDAAATADEKGDIWSLGVLLWELLSGYPLFDGSLATIRQCVLDASRAPERIPVLPHIPLSAQHFVYCCMVSDLKRRPSCEVLLMHEFLCDVDVKAVVERTEGHPIDIAPLGLVVH